MITDKDLFYLGCKLFGIYCLVLGIPFMLAVIPIFFPGPQLGAEYSRILRISRIVSLLIPLIYIGGGLYLIKDAKLLYNLAYREKGEHNAFFEDKILVFIKMLGLFLVVTFFPEVLKQISDFLIRLNTSEQYDFVSQNYFTISRAISSLGSMIFGAYLFIGGKFVLRMF